MYGSSVVAYLRRRRHNTQHFMGAEERSMWWVASNEEVQGQTGTVHALLRLANENSGSPKSREAHGDGVPIVLK